MDLLWKGLEIELIELLYTMRCQTDAREGYEGLQLLGYGRGVEEIVEWEVRGCY